MSDNSAIEWTDTTWNPVTGCDRVSPGCDHCYALTLAKRLKAMGNPKYQQDGNPRTSGPGFGVTFHEDALTIPAKWRKPRRVFVNSMGDLFHDDVSDHQVARVFAVMAQQPQHTFQVLTKRHARMRSLVGGDLYDLMACDLAEGEDRPARNLRWPLPNVWLGVSVESQQWADIRIPALLDTRAAVRFLSCEPLLGPVDLTPWLGACGDPCCPCQDGDPCHYRDYPGSPAMVRPKPLLDWVIAGGESGPGARPMSPDWARSLRDQCVAAGVPFLFKQWGNWAPFPVFKGAEKNTFVMDAATGKGAHYAFRNRPGYAEMWNVGKKAAGRELDGREWNEMPDA